jgi:hypothetical protein
MEKLNTLTKQPDEGLEKLDIIKEDNNLLEDFALIDSCLNKNIFMRNLNKSSR